MTETTAPPDVAAIVEALVALRPRRRCKVPLPLRRLIPEPLAGIDHWRRFTGEDIADMAAAARAAEALRLRVAIAGVADDETIPQWAVERLARLETAA